MTTGETPSLAGRVSEALLARKDELALAITDTLYDAHPDLFAFYGSAGRAKCLEDMRYTLEHLAPAVALAEPALFAKYVVWLAELLRARGIPAAHVRASLEATETVLAGRLARDEHDAVLVSLRAALATLSDGGAA